MKDGRTVRVLNPQLRYFRNTLRALYLRTLLDRNKTSKVKAEDLVDHSGGPLFPTNEKKQGYMSLIRSTTENKRMAEYTICICPICANTDRDMAWDQYSESWYCEDCYSQIYDVPKKGVSQIYLPDGPISISDLQKEVNAIEIESNKIHFNDLLRDLNLETIQELEVELLTPNSSILEEILDIRVYNLPARNKDGKIPMSINQNQLIVYKPLYLLLKSLKDISPVNTEHIRLKILKLFQSGLKSILMTLIAENFGDFITSEDFLIMCRDENSQFYSTLLQILLDDVIFMYFDSSLQVSSFVCVYLDDQVKKCLASRFNKLGSIQKKQVITFLSTRKNHKFYQKGIEDFLVLLKE